MTEAQAILDQMNEALRIRDNEYDLDQAQLLQLGIERLKIERNNDTVMRGLDRHFEWRGGCYDGEYDS